MSSLPNWDGVYNERCDSSLNQASRNTAMLADLSLASSGTSLDENKERFSDEEAEKHEKIIAEFGTWGEGEQVFFLKRLMARMSHYQLGRIDKFLRPMLQRDFIAHLPPQLAETVLQCLDAKGLCQCESVSLAWRNAIAMGSLWRKLIESKVRSDGMWKGLSEKRQWRQYLFIHREHAAQLFCELFSQKVGRSLDQLRGTVEMAFTQHTFYRALYPLIVREIEQIEMNWRNGRYNLKRINCRSENSKGVYCLQYDDKKIVSGLRDNTIKIWHPDTLDCAKVLTGHTGSVLCLQYDDRVIISGSSDATVRESEGARDREKGYGSMIEVWDVNTGECLNTLIHHCEAVLHLRFHNGIMVTCSKDRSIAVWTMVSPKEMNLRRVLLGHRAAVNVVDFDSTYIVSASGDRTIKVWSADSCEYIRTLSGHKRGIACLQYRDRLVVSGSSDNTIRLWNILCGACLRVLEGHEELVRCIRFDSKRIVSGAYDGKIKVWDLVAAMDPRSVPGSLCLSTLNQHTGRVFRLQFDDFQIVSSSHDDTILIWDFLDGAQQMPVPHTNANVLPPGAEGEADAAIDDMDAAPLPGPIAGGGGGAVLQLLQPQLEMARDAAVEDMESDDENGEAIPGFEPALAAAAVNDYGDEEEEVEDPIERPRVPIPPRSPELAGIAAAAAAALQRPPTADEEAE